MAAVLCPIQHRTITIRYKVRLEDPRWCSEYAGANGKSGFESLDLHTDTPLDGASLEACAW